MLILPQQVTCIPYDTILDLAPCKYVVNVQLGMNGWFSESFMKSWMWIRIIYRVGISFFPNIKKSQFLLHRPQCTVTLNSNFAILKTWNLFSITKRIIWVYSFVSKADEFLFSLFFFFFNLFFRNWSASNGRWFYSKKTSR